MIAIRPLPSSETNFSNSFVQDSASAVSSSSCDSTVCDTSESGTERTALTDEIYNPKSVQTLLAASETSLGFR